MNPVELVNSQLKMALKQRRSSGRAELIASERGVDDKRSDLTVLIDYCMANCVKGEHASAQYDHCGWRE